MAVEKYIEQVYPGSLYSQMFYLTNAPGTGFVQQEFSNEGAIAVIVRNIYWQSQNTNTVLTFRDQDNLPLCSQLDMFTQWVPINSVRKGQILKVTMFPATYIFTVSFQYIVNTRK